MSLLLKAQSSKLRNLIILSTTAHRINYSTATESSETEFSNLKNAYDILGVSESSSFAEIKSSFRKLAKQTHPDVTLNSSNGNSSSAFASQRFVQILAAYEILSDAQKRAHYDQYLSSQRNIIHREYGKSSTLKMYNSSITTNKEMEVVEWLRCYRLAIKDIVSEKKVVVGTGYFDVLEEDFYSAIHAAYYGPVIECMDLLPNRFEAEERSVLETPEILHLVSGRDLFGMVCLADERSRLSVAHKEMLTSFSSKISDRCQVVENESSRMNAGEVNDVMRFQAKDMDSIPYTTDGYKDLELHVSGRVVAVATRVPPGTCRNGIQNKDSEDHIHVFLNVQEHFGCKGSFKDSPLAGSISRIPLGTISGLGTSSDEGSCFVYDSNGTKTHIVMKHRTYLVKHMHWYRLGDEVSICECRCSRARLPPSRFWLFEPRCCLHDIGGWYVETFGKDRKGRTVPAQRYWDGFDGYENLDRRLHPAMYLLALAYRTLDIEDAKRRKHTVRDLAEGQLLKVLNWCKQLV